MFRAHLVVGLGATTSLAALVITGPLLLCKWQLRARARAPVLLLAPVAAFALLSPAVDTPGRCY
jgi:hypothetical protein